MKRSILWLVLMSILLGLWGPGPVQAVDSFYGTVYVDALYKNALFTDVANHWARDAICRMAALGVVREGSNYYRPEAYVSKEDAMGMLFRLADQEGAAQQLKVNEETGHRNPWGVNYAAMAVRLGIITAPERSTINWRAAATREEVAYWMARILNFAPVYGRGQQAVYSYRDWNRFDKARLPYCEAVIGAKIMTGRTEGWFYPQQGIRRGELAVALDRAASVFLPTKGFKYLQGTVAYANSWDTSGAGPAGSYYQVVREDGTSFYLVADTNKDFLVYKNHVLGRSNLLETGDSVQVLAGPQNDVVLVEASSGLQGIINGIFDYLDQGAGKLYLTGWDGKSYTVNLSPLCRVSLSGYPAGLNDLVPGQQVSVFLNGAQVAEVRGTVNYASSGTLPRDTLAAYGALFNKTPDTISVRDDNGYPHTYTLTADTRYYINGVSAGYYDLKTGDYLKLTLDSNSRVIRVDVRSDSGGYKIYRGRLFDVRSVFREIQFDTLLRYENGTLNDVEGSLTLDVGDDLEAYSPEGKLTLLELEKYRGEEAFFVTARRDDREQVIKLVLRGDSERRITGQVQETNPYLNSFTIKYEPDRITYDNGTIVISRDRLLDGDSIKAGDDAVIFATRDSGSTVKARLVVLNTVDESRYEICKGILERVLSRSKFEVDSASKLSNHEWRSDSSYPQYFYDSLTRFVYTDGSGNVQRMNDYQFYDRDQDFQDKDVRIIADGDRALAVMVFDGFTISNEVVTRGTITGISSDSMVLGSLSNWSSYSNRWEGQSGELTLKLKYAVAVKNGQAREPGTLAVGDPVYVLRGSVSGGGSDIYALQMLVE